jgi:purine-binding chemotaxis protein CheW
MSNQQPDFSCFIDDYMMDARGCFKEIRSSLIDIQKDSNNGEKFEPIRGGFHTIKGSSIILGFEEIGNFARTCEEKVKKIQGGPITNEALDELSKMTDHLEAIVDIKVKTIGKPQAAVMPENGIKTEAISRTEAIVKPEEKIPDKLALFMIENRHYALALDSIERVIRAVEVTPLPKSPENVKGVINMHGRIIPVLDLRILFKLPPEEIIPQNQMIILHTKNRDVALVVDNVSEVIESPKITAPDSVFPEIKYLKGMIRENTITLILDIDKIVTSGGKLDI